MTPYYEDDACIIYHARCEDVLPSLDRVDLIVTSPPYNIAGVDPDRDTFSHGGARNAAGAGTHFDKRDGYDDALPWAVYVEWQRTVLRTLWSHNLSERGAIFYNHKPRVGGSRVWLPTELIPDEIPLRQIIVWDRGSGFNRQFAYFVPSYEWIMLLATRDFRLVTRSIDDVWRFPPDSANEHPAPFPLALPARAIAATGAESVLDPFMGGGTTFRATKDAGVRAIGIEISERYCEIAAKRLAQEVLDFA